MLPHRHTASTSCGTWMCPRSPAAPCAPRRSSPSLMIPLPMPVATLTNMRWSTSGNPMACSPSAMMFTSLSTTTSEPSSARTKPGTSNPSHPGMIGGLVGRPVACSTGPGRPMPTPASSASPRSAAVSSARPWSTTHRSTASGPSAMSRSTTSLTSTLAARSATARRTWVAPTSAASTTRAAGLKANCVGGRPPDDIASPAAPTRSLASKASTRWATVERPRPVAAASSLRVRGTPSRRCCSKVPAPSTTASETHPTSALLGRLLLDIRQKCRRVGRVGCRTVGRVGAHRVGTRSHSSPGGTRGETSRGTLGWTKETRQT